MGNVLERTKQEEVIALGRLGLTLPAQNVSLSELI
jgi:hypothetical protein